MKYLGSRLWQDRVLPNLASVCAVCGGWPRRPVCAACLAEFRRPVLRCLGCALPFAAAPLPRPLPSGLEGTAAANPDPVCGACLLDPPAWQRAHAAVDYAYPWAGLIARLKYPGDPAWARQLAHLWPDPAQQAADEPAFDWVVPVPSTPERWRQRGFNPAYEIARHWVRRAQHAGLPTRLGADVLTRPYNARPQASLPRAQRLRNPSGAFEVASQAHTQLAKLRVLLVDDVMTTGSTLKAAAQALKLAGCRQLQVWVIARVQPPSGDEAVAADHRALTSVE